MVTFWMASALFPYASTAVQVIRVVPIGNALGALFDINCKVLDIIYDWFSQVYFIGICFEGFRYDYVYGFKLGCNIVSEDQN